MCVLILLYMCAQLLYVRPHTITSVPSYYHMCVLILPYVCPHTNFVVFITTQTFHCGPLN